MPRSAIHALHLAAHPLAHSGVRPPSHTHSLHWGPRSAPAHQHFACASAINAVRSSLIHSLARARVHPLSHIQSHCVGSLARSARPRSASYPPSLDYVGRLPILHSHHIPIRSLRHRPAGLCCYLLQAPSPSRSDATHTLAPPPCLPIPPPPIHPPWLWAAPIALLPGPVTNRLALSRHPPRLVPLIHFNAPSLHPFARLLPAQPSVTA